MVNGLRNNWQWSIYSFSQCIYNYQREAPRHYFQGVNVVIPGPAFLVELIVARKKLTIPFSLLVLLSSSQLPRCQI